MKVLLVTLVIIATLGFGTAGYPPDWARRGSNSSDWDRRGSYPPDWDRRGSYPPDWARRGSYPPDWARRGSYPPDWARRGSYPPDWARRGSYSPDWARKAVNPFGGIKYQSDPVESSCLKNGETCSRNDQCCTKTCQKMIGIFGPHLTGECVGEFSF